jgi:hypothetical protein
MEWFKHSTNSHEDPDISDAWDVFGDAGPLIFWTILEVFGAEYSHLNDGWMTISIPYFERKVRRKYKKVEKILEFFEKRQRIFFKKSDCDISITIPKFIKIASNWTIRPQSKPTQSPTEVPTEAPHAIEEEEKKKENKNPPISPQGGNDNIPQKEKKKKRQPDSFVLPSWIPQDTWDAYLAVRAKKKAAQTPYAYNLIIKSLETLRDKLGNDPLKVLNKSIVNGWTDVYPLKEDGNGTKPQQRTYPNRTDYRSQRELETDAEAERINREYYERKAKEDAAGNSNNISG